MDRKLKRAINLKITRILDSQCPSCKYCLEKNRIVHCKENCSVFNELNRLSSMLVNDESKEKVLKPTIQENLSQVIKGRYSEEDEFYLIHHAKYFSKEHLAKKLNRDVHDIYNKIYRLKLANKISV